MSTRNRHRRPRRAAAAAELALLLPVLLFLLLATVDFARLFYTYNTITNCARNGALYASDTTAAGDSPYADYKAAALADGTSLNPAISSSNITQASGTDANGSYVEVTVKYDFKLLSSYLGFSTQTISRTVRMRVAPATPN